MQKYPLLNISFLLLTICILTACSHKNPICITRSSTAIGVDDKLMPINETASFPAGTRKVFCWFQWQAAAINTTITAKWFFVSDNIHILDYSFEIPRQEGSGSVSLVMPDDKILPSGQYKIDLTLGNQILRSTKFTIN